MERAQARDARRWRTGLTRGAERSATEGRRRARLGRPRKVTGEGKEKARGPAVELGQQASPAGGKRMANRPN